MKKQSANTQIEQVFTLSALRLFTLFNNNHDYINNIAGIIKETGLSHVIVRKYLKTMVDLGILREIFVGNNGKVFTLNKDFPVTNAFRDFIEVLEDDSRRKDDKVTEVRK